MSTGTNRERLEQNNTLLEDIKTQIQNLPEAGGSGGIKQFSTIEEMNNSTGNKEGDLAVVYRSEIQNATVDSRFQTATFPDTVILDTAITGSIELRYRAVDSSKMFNCWGSLNSSRFSMDCFTDSGNIRIQYTSSDGITYTRTDTTGNPVDFGTEIYYERAERWNDAIGKFIQIGGSTFEGLYEYGEYNDGKLSINNVYLDNGVVKYSTGSKIPDIQNYENGFFIVTEKDDNGVVTKVDRYSTGFIAKYNNKQYIYQSKSEGTSTPSTTSYSVQHLDLVNNTETEETKTTTIINTGTNTKYYLDTYREIPTDTEWFSFATGSQSIMMTVILNDNLETGTWYNSYLDSMPKNILIKYNIAPTQLSATSDYVYEKEFYGQNGVESGTLTQNVSNQFTDMNAEVYSKIQQQYDKLEPRVLTDSDKTIDKNISVIPIKNDGTPLLDTSSVTSMQYMFQNCKKLTEIPLLDTGSVTNMYGMFQGCTNLIKIPQLGTSNVTNMSYMFSVCTNLTIIPLLNTSKVTNMDSMFQNCTNLTEIPLLDTSSVTDMSYMFNRCTNLTEIPLLDTGSVTRMQNMFVDCANLTTIPQLDTNNVTNIGYMFNGCANLTTIPLLNTSNATNMQQMFKNCNSLSDESLNNILNMCTNAVKITSNKTLKYIGLTSEQATKCQSLSNYSAFTSAGWTTGY